MSISQQTGIKIYYEVHGSEGSPILMIHGLGASKVNWPPDLIQYLSTRHRVIIFDNRGTGQSDKPQTDYTMTQFAKDAVGILDTLKIEQAHVFGVSLGGAIAQHFVINHPARVSSLTLMCALFANTEHPKTVAASEETLRLLAKPSSGDIAQDMRNRWPIMYSPAFVESHRDWLEQELQAVLANNYPKTPDYARQLQLQMMQSHDLYEQLSQISCPTLIQIGTDDRITPPENSRIMAKLIPNAKLIEYKDGGHLIMGQYTTKVAEDILSFIEDIS